MIRTLLLTLLTFSCTLFMNTSHAGVKDSIGVAKVDGELMVKYLVSPGETIYGISTKYHVPISRLLEINPELEAGLKVGQVIKIPYNAKLVEREKSIASGKVKIHKVQSGETLYSLSRKYNVSINELMKWNNLDLKIGQEVIVGYNDNNTPIVSKPAEVKPEPKPVVQAEPQPKAQEIKPEPAEVKKAEPVLVHNVAKDQSVEKVKAVSKSPTPVKEEVVNIVEEEEVVEPQEEEAIYPYDASMKQILIIPFDPYLYFSDADHEIAAKSKIIPTKVRQIFRRRMNAMMQMPGYESIFLLGGRFRDTLRDLNKIYSSVSYSYQDVIHSGMDEQLSSEGQVKNTKAKSWLEKQKEKLVSPQAQQKAVYDKHQGQYFGVKVRNPEEFFAYFDRKYSVDYYIFVNQFEVKTNYENCLDRAAHDFERTFTTHFSIFDKDGNQIAGNQFRTFYNSNSSYIYTIVADNMDKIAQRILSELPPAGQ